MSDWSGTTRIYLANPDGSGVAPLTTGSAPAWSADGRQIAFHRPGSGIYVIDADGANERFVSTGDLPLWSPDGTKITFNRWGTGDAGGVYVMNADGTDVTLLISHEFASPGWGDYCVCSPAWSTDGRTIAFVRANYDEPWDIFTIDADGSGSPSRFFDNGWTKGAPAWSPDGSRMAFETAGFVIDPVTGVQRSADQVASVTLGGSDFRVHVTSDTGYVGIRPGPRTDGASCSAAARRAGRRRGSSSRARTARSGS